MTQHSASMKQRLLTRTAALLALASAISVPGCFEPRPPINQVQPNVIEKAVFADEWYYQQTVIDSPYSAGFTFVGEQGSLERIRWEIQENYLIARRAYEFIAGSEPTGITGSAEDGAVVAAYRISSHFDIRRAYNPVTGEELNVITENNTDRPWYERRFMRVEWETNLADATDMFAISRVLDGLEVENVAYYVQDLNDPNRPRFETDPSDPDGPIQYMDIVNRLFVQPQEAYIEGFGAIPSCYLLYSSHLDCAASEITVRNSFLRVDPRRDYQPTLYTGDRMERFGYFVTERAGYDDSYGVVEGARHRFANRHNLWMSSHRRAPNLPDGTPGPVIACHADADCDDGRGSVCDLDYGRARRSYDADGLVGACTIPYRDREVRPVVYYTTANFPEDLAPDAQNFAAGWNEAFVGTIGGLREQECLANGGTDCAAEATRTTQAYAVCRSPVVEGDPEICGPVGTEARPGDLRYSIIGYVSEPHLSSPLGYGPSSADPTTGEIVMANAFVYGAAMETIASFGRDIVRLLNGDITGTEISEGLSVEEWLARVESGAAAETSDAHGHGHVIPVDGRDTERLNAAMHFDRFARDGEPLPPPSSFSEAMERVDAAERRLWRDGAFGRGDERGDARLSNLEGTDIERMMTTTDLRIAAGIDPTMAVTDEVLAAASPIRGMNPRRRDGLTEMRNRLQAQSCILDAEFTDQGLLGLARAIVRAASSSGSGTIEWFGVTYPIRNASGGIDYELVRTMMRHPIFEAVTSHEVGHTLGLRHNFSGSYDALNYLPEYWRLRNDGSVAPRAWDPITTAEMDGRILENQYSTVMDYGVNFVVTDANGISQYDHAAIAMGYGDLVQVFDDVADRDEVAWWNFIQAAGWPVPLELPSFTGGRPSAHEYTDWLEVVGDADAISARSLVPYESLVGNGALRAVGITDPVQTPDGRPAVPFMFCSDEQADLNPDCLRYDQGADAYETVQSVADSYWSYYIFTNFRRQRLGFSPSAVATRIHDRYFEKFARANQIYALYRPIMDEIFTGQPGYDTFWTRQDGMGAYTLAVGVGMNTLTRVLTAPEPGAYANATRPDGTTARTRTGAGRDGDPNSIGVFDGRFMETTWNFDAGYFWFDQLERVGYFYDKLAAIQVLVDPTTYFLGRDTDVDIRRYQLNFATTFPNAIDGLFRGLLGEDWGTVAPRFGTGGLVWPDPLQLEDGSMTGVPVDPAVGFSLQLYAAVFGMSYIPQTYDEHFLQSSRIWIRGGAEEVEIPPSFDTVEFTDPETGFTYVALSYPDGARETGVGAQLIQHALDLEARGSNRDLDRFLDNINLVRRLSWMLGFGVQPLSP